MPATIGKLLRQFNDYDQTVDVVSCWHFLIDYYYKDHEFIRFGAFDPGDGQPELTPDFAVGVVDKGTADPSAIFDIKKIPNPFPPNAGPENTERAQKNFNDTVLKIAKYGVKLTYKHPRADDIEFDKHDLVLTIPQEFVNVVYQHLAKSTPPAKKFFAGRPLILLGYFYNAADANESYVFQPAVGELNPVFSDPALRKHFNDRGQPARVSPEMFMPHKVRYMLCNDEPPSIYVIVLLWVEIFPKLLTPEQQDVWNDRSSRSKVEIKVSVPALMSLLKTSYDAPFRSADIKKALETLVTLKKARKGSEGEYVVDFSSLSTSEPAAQRKGTSKRNTIRDLGRVFAALIEKQAEEQQKKSTRGGKKTRAEAQIPLDF